MKKFASWAKRGLVVLSPLFVAMSAQAAGAGDNPSPQMRAVMQRDLGLTSTQLDQYLSIEHFAASQAGKLERAQGRNFGGSWIERGADGNYRFVVATTSHAAQRLPAGAQLRVVGHTLAELNAAKAQLDRMLASGNAAPKGVYGWYVDLQNNSVTVTVGKGHQQAGIDFVAASGANSRVVRIVEEEEQPSLRSTLQGGIGYLRNPGDGYLYACSIGFNVTKGTTPAYVSAGHCGKAGEPVYLELSPQWTLGPQIGSFSASSFPNPGQTGNDWSYVTESSGNTYPATVYGWGQGDAAVHGSTVASVGSTVCRSGRTSGWHCGSIQATGQTVNYSTGETILNLTRTSACSEGGDSGGSFITGAGQAQGVLSGGSGSCKGGGKRATSYFQPLLPILSAYGLTLRTQ